MNVSWSIPLKWFFQAIIVCALIILGLELGAQLALPEQIEQWRAAYFGMDQRFGFITKGALHNKDGYVNFIPDADIRIIAYYPGSKGNLTPEYDCSYKSDRLGFVSNSRSYQDTSILLFGDSFVQGDG